MNDLLNNVKPSSGAGDYRRGPSDNGDIELGSEPNAGDHDTLQDFFRTVESIKKDMERIKTDQREVMNTHEQSKAMIKSREVQQARQNMQDRIVEVSAMAHKVKGRIEALERANQAAQRIKGQGPGSANERTRASITAGLRTKFQELMNQFGTLRNRIGDEYRDQVKQRLYTVTGQQVDEDEVDKVIESGQADSIFQAALKMDQARGLAQSTLDEVEERHKNMQNLLRGLEELNQITVDLAIHVEEQGGTLERISKQVNQGATHVEKATEQIQEAKDYQSKSRKLMCWAAIIITIIAIIVVLAVVLTIKPWNLTH